MPVSMAISPAGCGISKSQGGGLTVAEKKETAIQNAIRAVLSDAGIVRRNNVGIFFTAYGARIAIGLPGEPDLTLFTKTGKTIFIEIKTPTGRQSEKQRHFQKLVEGYGFRYVVMRSVEDAKRLLREVQNE